jgi:hypothetical protein
MQIRIKSTPPGEAPNHVRRAWVGLVLPVPPHLSGQRRANTFGVLSGPGFGRQQSIGYIVESSVAVKVLADSVPEAADWWRANAATIIEPGRYFMFAPECCEELE